MSYNTSTNAKVAANDLLGSLKERAQLAAVFFSDVERAVVKATNRDIVVPKAKHMENIVASTWDRAINLASLFKILQDRLQEHYWVISFKTLLVIHNLMREGDSERVMGYLGSHSSVLNMTGYRDGGSGMSQSRNIKQYAAYLEEKVISYRELDRDYVRESEEASKRLQTLAWKDGLARETEIIQRQIKALLEARFYLDSVDNEVTLEALRFLVSDLLSLSRRMNEAVVNILQNFFVLEKADALKALYIYKAYVEQNSMIVEYFDVARRVQNGIGISIPELKSAPLSLASTLQDYIDSPDFERNRQEAIKKKQSKQQESTAKQPSSKQGSLVNIFDAATVTPSATSNALVRRQSQNTVPASQIAQSLTRQQSSVQQNFGFDPFMIPIQQPMQQQQHQQPQQFAQSAIHLHQTGENRLMQLQQSGQQSSAMVLQQQMNDPFGLGGYQVAQRAISRQASALSQMSAAPNAVMPQPMSQPNFNTFASPPVGAYSQPALPSHVQRQPSTMSTISMQPQMPQGQLFAGAIVPMNYVAGQNASMPTMMPQSMSTTRQPSFAYDSPSMMHQSQQPQGLMFGGMAPTSSVQVQPSIFTPNAYPVSGSASNNPFGPQNSTWNTRA